MIDHSLQNKQERDRSPVPIVLVSRPGVMRQSLRATLSAYPYLLVLASAGDGLTALNLVQRHQPQLLVIDSNLLDEEVEALLVAVKRTVPPPNCLACAHSSQRTAPLLAAGADAVILRSSSGQQWQETLLRLMRPAAL